MLATNKIKTTKFIQFLDIDDIAFAPVKKTDCAELGISFDDLLKMRFVIKLTNGRMVLEGLDQDSSSTDSPTVRGGEL